MESAPKKTPSSLGRFLGEWYGILLTLAVAVSALWLVLTGQHILYIHPRYTIFILEMASLAALACLWALWRGIPSSHSHDHPTPGQPQDEAHGHHVGKAVSFADLTFLDGEPGEEAAHRAGVPWEPRGWKARLGTATTAGLVVAASVMVLVLPPAPLSPSMAAQRGGGRATAASASNLVHSLADLPVEPNISHWAQLLSQQGPDDLTGLSTQIDGFVTTTPEFSAHGYYLTRFTIICCAVDAYPASVPIYDPQWREHVEVGQWLEVEGSFQPSTGGIYEKYALHPTQVTPIEEPAEPYLY